MPITGVYFVPSHPNSTTALPTITERLRSTFTDEDLIPVSRWALEHKLMRDTPSLLPSSQRPTKPLYMQFLSLTHYPTHGFIYTSEPAGNPFHPPHAATPTPSSVGAGTSPSPAPVATPMSATPSQPGNAQSTAAADISPMVMTTVPPSSYGALFQHFTYACQPFWCHRLTVAVPGGVVYDVGDFRVRMGDVRQTYPTGRVRGTVVEIEWRGPSVVETLITLSAGRGVSSSASGQGRVEQDDDSGIDVSFSAVEEADVDAEYAATASLIREFWGRLGVEGAREAILVPGVGKEIKEKLLLWKGQEAKRTGHESFRDEAGLGPSGPEEDPDPLAGADLARQYMEVLRFNR